MTVTIHDSTITVVCDNGGDRANAECRSSVTVPEREIPIADEPALARWLWTGTRWLCPWCNPT